MQVSKIPWTNVASVMIAACGLCGGLFATYVTLTSAQAVQLEKHIALADRTTKLESEQAQIKRDIQSELKEIRQLLSEMQRQQFSQGAKP